MATANRVMLIGNLVREPQIRTTGTGLYVATFTLAVDDVYAGAKEEAVRRTSYPTCKAWGKQVDKLTGLKKGDCIGVVGKLVTGSYDDKNGVKHYTTDVVVDKMVTFALPAQAGTGDVASPREEDGFGGEELSIPF